MGSQPRVSASRPQPLHLSSRSPALTKGLLKMARPLKGQHACLASAPAHLQQRWKGPLWWALGRQQRAPASGWAGAQPPLRGSALPGDAASMTPSLLSCFAPPPAGGGLWPSRVPRREDGMNQQLSLSSQLPASLPGPAGGPITATPVVLGPPCSAIPAAAVTDTGGGLPTHRPFHHTQERRQQPLQAEGWEPVASPPSVHLQPCTSRRKAHPSGRSPAAGPPPRPPHRGPTPVLTEPPADQSPQGPTTGAGDPQHRGCHRPPPTRHHVLQVSLQPSPGPPAIQVVTSRRHPSSSGPLTIPFLANLSSKKPPQSLPQAPQGTSDTCSQEDFPPVPESPPPPPTPSIPGPSQIHGPAAALPNWSQEGVLAPQNPRTAGLCSPVCRGRKGGP